MTSSSSSARGSRGERADDRDALLLAAREAVGLVVLAAGEAEAGEQLAGPLGGLGARDAVRAHRREHDVLEHGQVREEVVGLEDQPELAADGDRARRTGR